MARKKRASHRRSHKVKGWRKRSPHISSERRELLARCGKKAFLQPSKLKFPIVSKYGPCVLDCEGLRVAYARGKQYKHKAVASKAHKIAKTIKCEWVRK